MSKQRWEVYEDRISDLEAEVKRLKEAIAKAIANCELDGVHIAGMFEEVMK